MRVALGDTHGYHMLPYLCRIGKLSDCDIYHVGDFGVGFIGQEQTLKNLDDLDSKLKERGIRIFINRGNHDNPIYWKSEIYRTENVWFVPDNTIVEETLFLGGAISIDRMYRAEEKAGWWPEEVYVYEPILKELTGIKDVISHTAPSFCPPVGLNRLVEEFIDYEESKGIKTLRKMLKEEREDITLAFSSLQKNNQINTWNYGHFHKDYFLEHSDTKFRCLAINEFKEF